MSSRTILHHVVKPGRYLGHEFNVSLQPWLEEQLHCALLFPDLYEIGMSHQGLQILYHLLNASSHARAERCYCPDTDAETAMRRERLSLCALESGRPLADFDLLGITLPYELCFSNILTMLDLAGLPLRAADRDSSMPLVIGGGAGAFNPEPVAPFFDAILLGDGEEAILEITSVLAAGKKEQLDRARQLERLAAIPGIYIPAWFAPQYTQQGLLQEITALHPDAFPPRRRVLASLSGIDHLLQPLVPNAKIVHDRLGVEIARGCTRGCRFCQAGITYRPVRERSLTEIMRLAQQGIANSGFEELALLSLSTGDYSCLHQLLPQLMDTFVSEYVSVSLPSMRVGTLTPEIMAQIKRVRKTGFTLAPEAGSERLRRVINKGITEEDLLETCQAAFALGWQAVKLYFMIGLPTETETDLAAIVALCRKIRTASAAGSGNRKTISISVGTFVPKPHTPFQWHRQLSIAESREKISLLRQQLPKGINLKWHVPEQSFLEGVFSRGDRRLADLLETAWRDGARLDGWSEHFRLEIWRQAASQRGIDLDWYLRERQPNELLPWAHLHCGVDASFLEEERRRSLGETYTPDCRYHGCQGCGLCDFKIIQPIVQSKMPAASVPAPQPPTPAVQSSEAHYKYMVRYQRTGPIAFLGHLEFLQLIFRSLRRAAITTNFSQGFNPSPKVSFGPALPAGTESLDEYFIMDLPAPLASSSAVITQLNASLPPGLQVTSIHLHPGRIPQDILCHYQLTLATPLPSSAGQQVAAFLASGRCLLVRQRKGKSKEVDIRPLVQSVNLTSDTRLDLTLVYRSGESGVKPWEAAKQILGLPPETADCHQILKTGWQALPKVE